jgi:hypothetical protein
MGKLLTPHPAIKPKEFLRTRHNLRLAEREYIRIYDLLNAVELDFGKDIQEAGDNIFNDYNERWNNTCDYVLHKLKPKCWGVDYKYFFNVYKNQNL